LLEHGLSVKRYPVCYAAHRAIDGMLTLVREAVLKPAQIRKITARVGPAQAATLRYHTPTTGLEARFSLHHNLAAAVLTGEVGFGQLSDDFARRPDMAALYPLTAMEVDDEPCPDQPGMSKFDRIVIETTDNRTLDSGPIRYPRGHARLPLSDNELDAKFLDCARHGGSDDPARMLAALRGIDKLANLRDPAKW
jgi:2-methylcitrate dehydratase PrpD